MSRGAGKIGFLATARGPDYLRRLARLRWRRRFPSHLPADLGDGAPAPEAMGGAASWIVVLDDTSLPVPGGELPPAPGRVLRVPGRSASAPPIVHTLRELEQASVVVSHGGTDAARSPAIAFSASDLPPRDGETVSRYIERLLSPATPQSVASEFSAIVFDERDVCARERPEVSRHFPATVRRLLDVGCGEGWASAAMRRAHPALSVTGIEIDAAAAADARSRLDRVLEGDGMAALRALSNAGERFDAFLFADALEHFEDSIAALSLARGLADPQATLVASVPNVGHLSIVRDLIHGRFDPLPAGLTDAGHLRWFTRSSLEEALEEAGWQALRIESLPGAPAPDADDFLRSLPRWSDADRTSLTTYQWVAVAQPR